MQLLIYTLTSMRLRVGMDKQLHPKENNERDYLPLSRCNLIYMSVKSGNRISRIKLSNLMIFKQASTLFLQSSCKE